jgi:hypothetical protein
MKRRTTRLAVGPSFLLLLTLFGCEIFHGDVLTPHSSALLQCPIKEIPAKEISSTQPYDTPRYETKDMLLPRYSTENLKGNIVWQGKQVTYLDETRRRAYQVFVLNGLLYASDGTLFDTQSASSVFDNGKGRAIFVMDHYGRIYASTCQSVGEFHHSSLVAGAPISAAGEIAVNRGVISLVTRKSGHYRPDAKYQDQLFAELERQGVNIISIQRIDGF